MRIHPEIFYNLPEQHLPALETFWKLCGEGGLLARPEGLSKNETQEGLNDEVTLLSVPISQRSIALFAGEDSNSKLDGTSGPDVTIPINP
ncbi:SEC14 cytosolic factor [Penicillium malachiteum]|uniref:SEC14 cytosolic factor n=1 Tax=Penicillium malachiteum TaxID=1324776 RepID=UPI0025498884|nr:SEC14 cytosolic factor [Penicillium malachiteum]KAJ5730624.1 SEC14 cytosolic factor [Penicillium malachiteum]